MADLNFNILNHEKVVSTFSSAECFPISKERNSPFQEWNSSNFL